MAKRRYDFIEINGRRFKLDTKEKTQETPITRRSVWDCYERPSHYKEAIYVDWLAWFNHGDGYMTVQSYNCNFFTITGYITDTKTNKRYYCYITYANNNCIEVE